MAAHELLLPAAPRKNDSRATVRRILDAASAEFAVNGVEGARIDEIAKRAGVTKQLVYYYYGSKDHLYEAVLDAASDEAVSPLLTDCYDHMAPCDAVYLLFSRIFDQYRDRPELAAMTLDQNLHGCAHISTRSKLRRGTREVVAIFAALLQRGVASGDFRAGIDPQRFFATAFVILTGCFFSGRTMSTYIDLDMTSAAGVELWRASSLDFILSALAPLVVPAQPAG